MAANDLVGAAEGNEGPPDVEARRQSIWHWTVRKTRHWQTSISATLQKPQWGTTHEAPLEIYQGLKYCRTIGIKKAARIWRGVAEGFYSFEPQIILCGVPRASSEGKRRLWSSSLPSPPWEYKPAN